MKLKTLKDLPKSNKADFSGNEFQPSIKTAVAIEDLKAESVKWVKDCFYCRNKETRDCKVCNRFVRFFNITEEDLDAKAKGRRKMKEEFNLSDKSIDILGQGKEREGFMKKDVKEFIKLLKEELMHFRGVKQRLELIGKIDKLAGDKFVLDNNEVQDEK